jgi:hypothetical protein
MGKYEGKGWHFQNKRHSNARKYGSAGGKNLTMQDRRNIANFKRVARKEKLEYTTLSIPDKQTVRGVYDENTDHISLPHNSPDDLLAHEMAHAIDYKKTFETKHDKEFWKFDQKINNEI